MATFWDNILRGVGVDPAAAGSARKVTDALRAADAARAAAEPARLAALTARRDELLGKIRAHKMEIEGRSGVDDMGRPLYTPYDQASLEMDEAELGQIMGELRIAGIPGAPAAVRNSTDAAVSDIARTLQAARDAKLEAAGEFAKEDQLRRRGVDLSQAQDQGQVLFSPLAGEDGGLGPRTVGAEGRTSMYDILRQRAQAAAAAKDRSALADAIGEAIDSGFAARFGDDASSGAAVPAMDSDAVLSELTGALSGLSPEDTLSAVNSLATRAGVPNVSRRMVIDGMEPEEALDVALRDILLKRSAAAGARLAAAKSRPNIVDTRAARTPDAEPERQGPTAPEPLIDREVVASTPPSQRAPTPAIDPVTGQPVPLVDGGVAPKFAAGTVDNPSDPSPLINYRGLQIQQGPSGLFATTDRIGLDGVRETVPDFTRPVTELTLRRTGDAGNRSAQDRVWVLPLGGGRYQQLGISPDGSPLPATEITPDQIQSLLQQGYKVTSGSLDITRRPTSSPEVVGLSILNSDPKMGGVRPQDAQRILDEFDAIGRYGTREQVDEILATAGAGDPDLGAERLAKLRDLQASYAEQGAASASRRTPTAPQARPVDIARAEKILSQLGPADVDPELRLPAAERRKLTKQREGEVRRAASALGLPEGSNERQIAEAIARMRQASAPTGSVAFATQVPRDPSLQGLGWSKYPATQASSASAGSLGTSTTDLVMPAGATFQSDVVAPRSQMPVGSQVVSENLRPKFASLFGLGWRGKRQIQTGPGSADPVFAPDISLQPAPGISSNPGVFLVGGSNIDKLPFPAQPDAVPSDVDRALEALRSSSRLDMSDPDVADRAERLFPVGIAPDADQRLNFMVEPGSWAASYPGGAANSPTAALARLLQSTQLDTGVPQLGVPRVAGVGIARPSPLSRGVQFTASANPATGEPLISTSVGPSAVFTPAGPLSFPQRQLQEVRLASVDTDAVPKVVVAAEAARLLKMRADLVSQAQIAAESSRKLAGMVGQRRRAGQEVPEELLAQLDKATADAEQLDARVKSIPLDEASVMRLAESSVRERSAAAAAAARNEDPAIRKLREELEHQRDATITENQDARGAAGQAAQDVAASQKLIAGAGGLIRTGGLLRPGRPRAGVKNLAVAGGTAPLTREQLIALYDASGIHERAGLARPGTDGGAPQSPQRVRRPLGLGEYDARLANERPGKGSTEKAEKLVAEVNARTEELSAHMAERKRLQAQLKKSGPDDLNRGELERDLEAANQNIEQSSAALYAAQEDLDNYAAAFANDKAAFSAGAGENQARLVEAVMSAETPAERARALEELLVPTGYWKGEGHVRGKLTKGKVVALRNIPADEVLSSMAAAAKKAGVDMPDGAEAEHILYSLLKNNAHVDSQYSDDAIMDTARKAVAGLRREAPGPQASSAARQSDGQAYDIDLPANEMDVFWNRLDDAEKLLGGSPEDAMAARGTAEEMLRQLSADRPGTDGPSGSQDVAGPLPEPGSQPWISSVANAAIAKQQKNELAQRYRRIIARANAQLTGRGAKPLQQTGAFQTDAEARFKEAEDQIADLMREYRAKSTTDRDASEDELADLSNRLAELIDHRESLRPQLPAGSPDSRPMPDASPEPASPKETDHDASPRTVHRPSGYPTGQPVTGKAFNISADQAREIQALLAKSGRNFAPRPTGDADSTNNPWVALSVPTGTALHDVKFLRSAGPGEPLTVRARPVKDIEEPIKTGEIRLVFDKDGVPRVVAERSAISDGADDIADEVVPAGGVAVNDQRGTGGMGDEYLNPEARPAGMDAEVSGRAAESPATRSTQARGELLDAALARKIQRAAEDEAIAATARGPNLTTVSAEGKAATAQGPNPTTVSAEGTPANPLSDPQVREASRSSAPKPPSGDGKLSVRPGWMLRNPRRMGLAAIAAGLAGGGGDRLDEHLTGGRVSGLARGLSALALGSTTDAADPWAERAAIGEPEAPPEDTNEVPEAVIQRVRRARSAPFLTFQNPLP
jgi:hypothetical protein